jgi:predicted Zn-dependent protease
VLYFYREVIDAESRSDLNSRLAARAEAARIATLDAYRGAMADARIAEHEKEWPKAERLYRSLMAEYPDRTAAVDALVTILQNARRFDDAFKIVDDRLARLPDESSSLYNLGRLSAVSGQHLASGHDQGKDWECAGGGN